LDYLPHHSKTSITKILYALQPLKPMGLFATLDDESRMPGGSDMGFIDKLTKTFPSLPDFKRSRGQQLEFMIQHFAGQVRDIRLGTVI
jgi:myosin heavy subunit